MAITQDDLDQLRSEFDAKLATVNVDHMKTASELGAYAGRFTALDQRMDGLDHRVEALRVHMNHEFDLVERRFVEIDRRFEEVYRRFDDADRRIDRLEARMDTIEHKLDSRFARQTFMFALLGLLVLFDDAIRPMLGL